MPTKADVDVDNPPADDAQPPVEKKVAKRTSNSPARPSKAPSVPATEDDTATGITGSDVSVTRSPSIAQQQPGEANGVAAAPGDRQPKGTTDQSDSHGSGSGSGASPTPRPAAALDRVLSTSKPTIDDGNGAGVDDGGAASGSIIRPATTGEQLQQQQQQTPPKKLKRSPAEKQIDKKLKKLGKGVAPEKKAAMKTQWLSRQAQRKAEVGRRVL